MKWTYTRSGIPPTSKALLVCKEDGSYDIGFLRAPTAQYPFPDGHYVDKNEINIQLGEPIIAFIDIPDIEDKQIERKPE